MDDFDAGDIVITRVRPEPCEDVTIRIPLKAIVPLREMAEERDMSVEALLRFYIGQGLREDVLRRWTERHGAEGASTQA